jgi:hypothetical protein
MNRTVFATAALLIALAMPANAGTAPVVSKATPETITAACGQLGSKGEDLGTNGSVGCRNTETGAAAVCSADGQCKDYFADPRYKRIKAILDANRKQQAPVKL